MAPTRRNNDGLLARVNFPLYTLQMISSRHVLVAGGGGSSKTGVANGFEIFELSHNGDTFVAEEIVRHETGPSVVMNCASYNNGKHIYLVAGQESHCQLYYVQTNVVDASSSTSNSSNSTSNNMNSKNDRNSKTETRQRRKDSASESVSNNKQTNETAQSNSTPQKRITFSIRPSDSIQTDFSSEEPLQKVVRISRTGKIMATGGTDGHVRIWQFPAFRKLHDIDAHTKEVDDLDMTPDGGTIVTLSKDGLCTVWNTKTGKRICTLSWQVPEGVKYIYKRCRFGNPGSGSSVPLFTLTNPSGRTGGHKSFLQLWEASDGTLRRSHAFSESLAALAVRDDGLFVAVGTMFTGSVSVHIAFSLQKVLNVVGAHGMFVTGLEFLPTAQDGPAITTPYEAAVISISVDNRVCVHKVPFRHTMPMWLVIILMVLVLCASFTICSYLGV